MGRPDYRAGQCSRMPCRILDGQHQISTSGQRRPILQSAKHHGLAIHLPGHWLLPRRPRCVHLKLLTSDVSCSSDTLGLFTPFFYIVEYARHLSISDRMSFYVLAVMNAGGIVGRVAPAYLSDRLGRFNLLFPSALFSGLACIIGWLFTKDITALMAFCALYGFFSGAFISLITPCVAQISDLSEIGMRIGMLYTTISVP
jgi:MFS family permease